jgi:hypothetical protein
MISLPVPVCRTAAPSVARDTIRARVITAANPVLPPMSCSSPAAGVAVDVIRREEAVTRAVSACSIYFCLL